MVEVKELDKMTTPLVMKARGKICEIEIMHLYRAPHREFWSQGHDFDLGRTDEAQTRRNTIKTEFSIS